MDIDLHYKYPERIAELNCSHCGSTTEYKNAVIKNDRIYCCNGCYGISNLIYSLGLGEYYSLRNLEKHRSVGRTENKSKGDDFSYLNQDNFKKLYTTEESPNIIKFYMALCQKTKTCAAGCRESRLHRASGRRQSAFAAVGRNGKAPRANTQVRFARQCSVRDRCAR